MINPPNRNLSNDAQPPDSRRPGDGLGRRIALAVLVATVLMAAATCFIFVDERESVIVERLGNIVQVYDRSADRGAHFKLPWPIDLVRRFDRRVRLFDPPAREMFTSDKKNVTVDVYVCWRVAEPAADAPLPLLERPVVRFYRGMGGIDLAESLLESRVRSIMSTAIGQVELSHLLGVRNSEDGPDKEKSGLLQQLSETVRSETIRRANEKESLSDRLGMEIVDLRITRLNLPAGNQQAVFERMKSERKKIADRYRSAGLAQNQMIRSQADRQYNEILAKSRADAERIRGTAEAEAIRILNAAHGQDPEFYAVLATLDAYRKILNEKTTLILSASSSLLKLLSNGVPELKGQPNPANGSTPAAKAADAPSKKSAKNDVPSRVSGIEGGSR